MKKIMLDHFRRWWWVLATGAAIQIIVFWFSSITAGTPSDFLFFPFATFLGAFPLSFDLQRGHARAIIAMPVTVRGTARAWWLATVAVPAIVLALSAVLSAGISCLVHANGKFHADWLMMNSVLNLLWLGASFFLLTGLNPGVASNWWEQTRNVIFGALWGLSFAGGFIFCEHIATNNIKMNSVLIVCSIMSIAGWHRAERLVRQRVGFRSALPRARKGPVQPRISKGFNGVPLLLIMTVSRTLLIWLVMIAFMVVFTMFQGQARSSGKSLHEIIQVMSNSTPFWFIIIFQTFPILMNLRFLRTLPLSTTKLASILVALPVLSVLALAAVSLALVIPTEGVAKSFEIVVNYLTVAALVAWCVPLAVWQGFNRQTMYLMLFILFLGVIIPLPFLSQHRFSFAWIFPISLLLIIAAIWLTQRLLAQSRHAYRSWPNPFIGGWSGWNWGR